MLWGRGDAVGQRGRRGAEGMPWGRGDAVGRKGRRGAEGTPWGRGYTVGQRDAVGLAAWGWETWGAGCGTVGRVPRRGPGAVGPAPSLRRLPAMLPPGPARQWLEARRAGVRPWGSFLDQRRFGVPRNFGELCQRLSHNAEHFQSNYLFVFLGLILYCL